MSELHPWVIEWWENNIEFFSERYSTQITKTIKSSKITEEEGSINITDRYPRLSIKNLHLCFTFIASFKVKQTHFEGYESIRQNIPNLAKFFLLRFIKCTRLKEKDVAVTV